MPAGAIRRRGVPPGHGGDSGKGVVLIQQDAPRFGKLIREIGMQVIVLFAATAAKEIRVCNASDSY